MIKLFEEYNDMDEYYQRIDKTEWDKYLYNNMFIRFSDDEIKVLKNLFSVEIGPYFMCIKLFVHGSIIYMYKIPDEWYLVLFDKDYYHLYYKCDQMEGLIKLLKDIC